MALRPSPEEDTNFDVADQRIDPVQIPAITKSTLIDITTENGLAPSRPTLEIDIDVPAVTSDIALISEPVKVVHFSGPMGGVSQSTMHTLCRQVIRLTRVGHVAQTNSASLAEPIYSSVNLIRPFPLTKQIVYVIRSKNVPIPRITATDSATTTGPICGEQRLLTNLATTARPSSDEQRVLVESEDICTDDEFDDHNSAIDEDYILDVSSANDSSSEEILEHEEPDVHTQNIDADTDEIPEDIVAEVDETGEGVLMTSNRSRKRKRGEANIGRKRTTKPETWERTVRKDNRDKGLAYTTRKG